MCYEVPDDLVPGLDQPELGLGPMKAPCPIDTDKVEKSSVLSTKLQMVDRPPADAELIGFLDMVSSPNPLEALADHHGKAHGVLSRGMGATVEGILEADDSIQVEPVSVSSGDPLDGGREGWAQDVPRELQIQPVSGIGIYLGVSFLELIYDVGFFGLIAFFFPESIPNVDGVSFGVVADLNFFDQLLGRLQAPFCCVVNNAGNADTDSWQLAASYLFFLAVVVQ
ncbi:hypothetical protein Nepgr_016387 [Nepenthes gracilis]|uniref:Uncharacterized protein n=1 Tax=Nepenthes gracilis TaxID=150966 RepID=A0AAD3SQ79_NEPGR|nr:hypothetical protein Nepgr_016387 [Nepenthes gracilis]